MNYVIRNCTCGATGMSCKNAATELEETNELFAGAKWANITLIRFILKLKSIDSMRALEIFFAAKNEKKKKAKKVTACQLSETTRRKKSRAEFHLHKNSRFYSGCVI